MRMINPAVVIPARRQSSRFPDKPLVMIGNRPLINHCARAAVAADIGPVFLVTDDPLIAKAVEEAGDLVQVVHCDAPVATGTDRVAWAVRSDKRLWQHDVIINMQGDILAIRPGDLRAVLYPLTHRGIHMATLATAPPPGRAERMEFIGNRSKVKMTSGPAGPAFWRDRLDLLPGRHAGMNINATLAWSPVYEHVGVYAFPAETLAAVASWPRSPTELQLDLEQWRAIDHGLNIGAHVVAGHPISVNLPSDVAGGKYEIFTG